METIAVLGAGSWGATLANLLAEKGHQVRLWEINPDAAQALSSTRRLRILPELNLHLSVQVSSDIGTALRGAGVILSATPSHFVRSTMKTARASGALSKDVIVISVSKGLEETTLKRMSELISEELQLPATRVGVLAGPSHAEEVCRRLPAALVTASPDPKLTQRIQTIFSQDYFRVYTHSDTVGVELGGVLKNIFAVACGISDGLRLGDNTKAAIMTRGLNEIAKIGVKMGAQAQTFFGLAGMGDLMVTCMSVHSRNRSFGEKIGQGKTPQQALSEMTMVVEGYKTTHSAYALVQRYQLDCPLITEIYRILYENKAPKASMHDLMTRVTQTEWSGEEFK